VPAALMGLDTIKFLDLTEEMVEACASCVPVEENPGVVLGIILGTAAKSGRDKVTIVTSPGISDLGAWLEQLLAESTGKQGKGIIPVDREELGPPEFYGNDRIFAYVRLEGAADSAQEAKIAVLEEAGHPVVRRRGHVRSWTGIFPLGNRYRSCRLNYRNQCLQSVRCRSQQSCYAQSDCRIRKERISSRRKALLRGGRDQTVHGR